MKRRDDDEDDADEEGPEVLPSTAAAEALQQVKKKQKRHREEAPHGNYAQYYGYRSGGGRAGQLDPRLQYLRREWLAGKDVLDVGCNTGAFTIAVAERYHPRSVLGIDVDAGLVNRARAALDLRRSGTARGCVVFQVDDVSAAPAFVQDTPRYDAVLCMSVTKWVHLNGGDAGLMCMFRRIHALLRDGGVLVLEPQPWKKYRRRAKTPEAKRHYAEAQLRPDDFPRVLLQDVGFAQQIDLHIPKQAGGFDRPIYAFIKRANPAP
jgi:7SK snRNA methylphosphate capping enzyme